MNLTQADVMAILDKKEEFYELGHPWNMVILCLAQDWVEMARKPLDAMKEALEIAKTHEASGRLIAQIETLEEVLRLPLCDTCRKMIGEKSA
jgi:hypothetical protein